MMESQYVVGAFFYSKQYLNRSRHWCGFRISGHWQLWECDSFEAVMVPIGELLK